MKEYLLKEEKVILPQEFPLIMFSHSVPHNPIAVLHCHNELEIGICIRGNGIFIIDHNIHIYEAGDVVAIAQRPGRGQCPPSAGQALSLQWYAGQLDCPSGAN